MTKCFPTPGIKKAIVLILITVSALKNITAQLTAFPEAEGYGKFATGGRGGKTVTVTNLNNDGPGSFREALKAYPGEPITIVFAVGGIIELSSALELKRSNVTIAGQTAPGDGICLKGHSFIINGAGKDGNKGNIIIRYIRSRPGSTISSGIYGLDIENCHDIIIDHCSFCWANEECVAAYDVKNITIQWCIVSEGLYDAGHHKGRRSYGGVWGGQYASFHHNLLAHLNSRTVRFNGARAHDTIALVDYRNNVNYDWGNANACYGGDVKIPGGISHVNMINNYYEPGPATANNLKFLHALYADNPNKIAGQWYIDGNVMVGNKQLTNNNWDGVDLAELPEEAKSRAKSDAPFDVLKIPNLQSAKDAYTTVLAGAGATLPKRDAIDTRIVNDAKHTTASGSGVFGKPGIIDSPMAVGGWGTYNSGTPLPDTDGDGIPDAWEIKHQLNPKDAADAQAKQPSGYTNLEAYLNSIGK